MLLWPKEREALEGIGCSLLQKPLADPFQTEVHGREGMRRALDIVVANHLNY
ncbi:hypothetical protein [Endozoicomonas sp. 2B-B]